MNEDRVRCIDCIKPRLLTDEEKQYDLSSVCFCTGEGGSKSLSDVFAYRLCSRYQPGTNPLTDQEEPTCDKLVNCLKCSQCLKVPYRSASPTHHENWKCKSGDGTKQYEDVEAKRCCNMHRPGNFKDQSQNGVYK